MTVTTVVPLFKLLLNLLSFNSYFRFCIKTAVIMHKQNQNLQQNEVIMHFCMIKTGTKLTDIKILYMYEYLYFDMYILFLCRSLTYSLMWLIKRRLIDGLLLQLPLLRWQKTWRKEKRVFISGTVDKVSLCHLNWNYMYYQYFSSSKTKRQVEFF